MRVLVVGATGALGYSTVRRLLRDGHHVRALVRDRKKLRFGAEVEAMDGDAERPADLDRGAQGCAAVFYCLNVPLPQWATRLVPLLDNALRACRTGGAKLVFPGNVWVFGRGTPGDLVAEDRPKVPCSRKGRLRLALEERIAGSGARFTIVRLPEFYGPNVANPLMGEPFRRALAGQSLIWWGGHLDVRVEYVFIEDAAAALVQAGLAPDTDGETFHVPGHSATTPRAFLTTVNRLAGGQGAIRAFPPLLVRCAGLFHRTGREFADILHLWRDPILLDGRKYERRFGSVPRKPYEEGIGETVAWFREHPEATNAN